MTKVDEESEVKSLFRLFLKNVGMVISINTSRIPLKTEVVKGPLNKAAARTPGTYYSPLR